MTYIVTKIIKGNPYLYEVRSERDGDRVRQVFVRYLGRADRAGAVERRPVAPEVVSVEPEAVAVEPEMVVPEVEPEIIITPKTPKVDDFDLVERIWESKNYSTKKLAKHYNIPVNEMYKVLSNLEDKGVLYGWHFSGEPRGKTGENLKSLEWTVNIDKQVDVGGTIGDLKEFYNEQMTKPEPEVFPETVTPEVTPTPPKEVSPEAIEHRGTEPGGISIADGIGVRYDGIQEGVGFMFTDVKQTGSTFTVKTFKEAETKLVAMRGEFAKAEAKPPAVTPVAPEVTPTPPAETS